MSNPQLEFVASKAKEAGYTKTASGLVYKFISSKDTGLKPSSAKDTVTVHYTGTLTNGKVFDSSVKGDPISFPLNGVIAGWTEGVQLMKVGEKAEFVIPSDLAYGTSERPWPRLVGFFSSPLPPPIPPLTHWPCLSPSLHDRRSRLPRRDPRRRDPCLHHRAAQGERQDRLNWC